MRRSQFLGNAHGVHGSCWSSCLVQVVNMLVPHFGGPLVECKVVQQECSRDRAMEREMHTQEQAVEVVSQRDPGLFSVNEFARQIC